MRFWKISTSSMDPVALNSEPISPTLAPIRSVSLQAKDCLAFSIDSEGVVKIRDILTGCCKETHKTQTKDINCGDMQLIGNRLIIVWCKEPKGDVYIWKAEKGRL